MVAALTPDATRGNTPISFTLPCPALRARIGQQRSQLLQHPGISIHTLRAEGDLRHYRHNGQLQISIHTLRTEGDSKIVEEFVRYFGYIRRVISALYLHIVQFVD